MTVSELTAKLAGLPPMMEVYADSEGTSMFLNDIQVQEAEGYPPFLRLMVNRFPMPVGTDEKSYDEQLADMRQRAMHLARQSEDETRPQRMVE